MEENIEVWLTNIDFQLVVYTNKEISYMTKYVCKIYMEITKGRNKIDGKLINFSHLNCLRTPFIYIFTMIKLVDSHKNLKQEACHLILVTSMVWCSHMFHIIILM